MSRGGVAGAQASSIFAAARSTSSGGVLEWSISTSFAARSPGWTSESSKRARSIMSPISRTGTPRTSPRTSNGMGVSPSCT
jgi:hypothetical protein